MRKYDILFIGHVTIDEVEMGSGSYRRTPGGAPFYGAFACLPSKKRVGVITKMSKADEHILTPLKERGVDVYLIDTPATTHMRVIYRKENIDDRIIYQTKNAGYFRIDELPSFEATIVHLGALTDQEFTLEFIEEIRRRAPMVTVDLQGIVRQVDRETGRVDLRDNRLKTEIIKLADVVKLDTVEAEILTGAVNPERALDILDRWHSKETVLTSSKGIFLRYGRVTYFERYTNRSNEGRTGRGDTTIAAYISWRLDHNVKDSLRYAAQLTSLKLETEGGPFLGTLEDVLAKMWST